VYRSVRLFSASVFCASVWFLFSCRGVYTKYFCLSSDLLLTKPQICGLLLSVIQKICKIEGCEKNHFGLGLCIMHYGRVRRCESDMRPEPLPHGGWRLKGKIRKGTCSLSSCNNAHYAKGFCRSHYLYNKKYGTPYKPVRIITEKGPCSVVGCKKISITKGFCNFHYGRHRNGTPTDRPYGIGGKLNPRWNNGASQYKNHHKMKQVRKFILEMADWKCHYCNSIANEIHHRDLSKDNHSVNNLVATCHKCNRQRRTSKYKKIYGKTILQIANELGRTIYNVRKHHENRSLKLILN